VGVKAQGKGGVLTQHGGKQEIGQNWKKGIRVAESGEKHSEST